jgi:hypothetical protein
MALRALFSRELFSFQLATGRGWNDRLRSICRGVFSVAG